MKQRRITFLGSLDFYSKLCKKAKEKEMTISVYIRYALLKLWEEK